MSLSSWLGFGKKKSPTESDVPAGNNKTEIQADSDDFILVEGNTKQQGNMYPNLSGRDCSSLPYQVVPHPPSSHHSGIMPATEALALLSSNPLDDVPFKLSSRIDGHSCAWTASDMAHFTSVLSRASQLNETVFKYDFSNEQSVLNEEQSRDIG